jgi:hypothetical protein
MGVVVGGIAVVAILVSLRSIYQERRKQGDVESARATVAQQLEAFKAGDFQKAFSFAASDFHESMTLADFRKMVEDGYPQIAHNQEVRFGRTHWDGDMVGIDITVTGQDGTTAPHTYLLSREPDGWKVAGVSGGIPQPPRPESPTTPEKPEPKAPPSAA